MKSVDMYGPDVMYNSHSASGRGVSTVTRRTSPGQLRAGPDRDLLEVERDNVYRM